jgi:hypothetical protein
MSGRSRLALIAGLLVAGCLSGRAAPLPPVPLLSRVEWRGDHEWFGGFSGLVVAPDGAGFVAVNDRGWITEGQFIRDTAWRMTGVAAAPLRKMRGKTGRPLSPYLSDAEDMARAPDGSLFVAFEGWVRVSRYGTPDGLAQHLPRAPAFDDMNDNKALESLAIAPDGMVYAIPEWPLGGAHPLFRFDGRGWSAPFSLPAHGTFLPVSAAFGPDGRLYLLERDAVVPVGFATRLRRFDWGAQGPSGGVVLAQTGFGVWDNAESVSVWRGPAGLVATLLSDDNFLPVQRTEFIEIALPD